MNSSDQLWLLNCAGDASWLDPVTTNASDPFALLFPDQTNLALPRHLRNEIRRMSKCGGQVEAEQEVFLQELVKLKGSRQAALLHVVIHMHGEQTGARPTSVDSLRRTPLHHAVRRRLLSVCQKLLQHRASPDARDINGVIPFAIALEQQDDDISALLLSYMRNSVARSLFLCGESSAEFNFHQLLMNGESMQKTVLSLLDCLFDERSDVPLPLQCVRMFYNLLESDSAGCPPDHPLFNEQSKSGLHVIARLDNKSIVYHDAVRLLIRRKWVKYVKVRFLLSALIYIVKLFLLTYSAVVACAVEDPFQYADNLQLSRLATEGCAYLLLIFDFILELIQMCQQRCNYCGDRFNYVDIASVSCLLAVLPLRVLRVDPSHWYVFSIGYLLMTMRVFKYAAVFRETGVHSQILWKIVSQDIVQFVVVFGIFLLAFSGAIMLSMRGDHGSPSMTNSTSIIEEQSFWNILFMGIRTLVEAQPVVDYTNPESGYNWLSQVLMVMYLMTCIVVLLNILIAQLSDTYHNIKIDAQKALELNRAAIVTRVELNSIFAGKGFRRKHYVEFEDVSQVLEKWEGHSTKMEDRDFLHMRDVTNSMEMNLHAIKSRLAQQEHAINEIRNNMNLLLEKLGVCGKNTNEKASRRLSI
ncbi:hypothetical protein CAPTEDRAFT_225530 [Capitella teleta]|uniref:Ion transport domain-containing protein n=1 Tax=Capitella teleta TaxID=283909 RepID=R7T4N2_CAPTE|nr:hypothetical protein CAPTEDRAFT_225530 [Capitella teleta]|eukprot:ELT88017.1 hypothetical protein CAPTEDRAFT_225530 [Capitella teleta]